SSPTSTHRSVCVRSACHVQLGRTAAPRTNLRTNCLQSSKGHGHRVITATKLTKRYGSATAVDGLNFEVQPGIVTGFLGPNGAGKTTTMRLILGLDSPTDGTVTVNGQSYRAKTAPMQEVGALI